LSISSFTVGEQLPWVVNTFNYTERVVNTITPDLFDWRPDDPSGGFMFSVGELVMHITDSRRDFARQLSGASRDDRYWSPQEFIPEDGVWTFRPRANYDEIYNCLRMARAELDVWLELPADRLLQPTSESRKLFDYAVEKLENEGKKPSPGMVKRGPLNPMRVMTAAAIHEAGHRGTLQTMLRMNGVSFNPRVKAGVAG
jgi:hypothetical protein